MGATFFGNADQARLTKDVEGHHVISAVRLGAVQKCQHFHKCTTNRTLGGGVKPDVRF